MAARLPCLEASPMQVLWCYLCPAASVVISWHLGLSLWDTAESPTVGASPGYSGMRQRAGCFTLPGVKRRSTAAVWNRLNAPEAELLTCTALFVDHSRERPCLSILRCPRDAPPDFKAIAGSVGLRADFSGEAPTWSTLGSP